MISRRLVLAGTASMAVAPLLGSCGKPPARVRLGFLVKQPEAQWFQDEWRFAALAARDRGFDLLRVGVEDGDRVLAAIDTLYARYARGFVICAPDPRLGAAIRLRAAATGLKVFTVDDRLLGSDDQPIATFPYLGISASLIGGMAGREAVAEAARRRWDLGRTGVLRLAFDSLETGRERTKGAVDAVVSAGLSRGSVFDAPQRTSDTEGGFAAAGPVLARGLDFDHWIVLGLNDEAVLGGVRAAEGLNLPPRSVIGVGIGGSGTAVAEFAKSQPTGFHASVLLSPRRHGYDTASMLYDWVVRDLAPPPVTYTTGTIMRRANYRALLRGEAA